MEPKIGIVIVNYNGIKFQNESIRSIIKSRYSNYEIIVVDNDSTDGSIEVLKQEFPSVTVIETGVNHGVAKGNNIGIKEAIKRKSEYIMLLNNDIELEENLINILMANADKTTITVPKIYYYDKKLIWSAGGVVDWETGLPTHIGYGCPDGKRYSYKREVEIAPTCCMLIHKNIFKIVGLMDVNYFMYYDDTDFCIRANEKGIKTMYIPEAIMWHKVSSSSGGEKSRICRYYSNRNLLYFMKKYKNKVGRKKYKLIFRRVLDVLLYFRTDETVKYILIGYLDYIFRKMGRKDFK